MTTQFEVSVSADGGTVWVNDPVCCLGRFSKRFGMDVHRSLADQKEKGQCLYCTHDAAGPDDWRKFCFEMCRHHGVRLDVNLVSFGN